MTAFFEHPAVLFLALAALPAALIFYVRFRTLRNTLMPLVSRIDDSSIRPLSRILRVRSVFFALSWILLVCAAAVPRWGSELVSTRQEGSSVLFLIDVSRSMTVTDVAPSRLSFASNYASVLSGRMANTRCGVVLVKGNAILSVPLTSDHRALEDLFSALSPAMLSSPGSALSRGISVALESFPANSSASRTIILLSDGEETSGSLDEAGRALRDSGVQLIAVGIGTHEGKELNAFPSLDEPRIVTTVLHDDILKKTVKIAGHGSLYVNGLDTGSAQRVLSAILPAMGNEQKLVYSSKPIYRYSFFLFAALFCFCCGSLAGGIAWKKK